MAMEREMRVTSRRDSRMSRPMYHIVKFKPWNTDHSDGARGCSQSYSYKETMSSNYQKNLVLQRASVWGRWVSDKRLGFASSQLEQTVQTLLARAALAAAAQTSAKSAARGSLARAAALLLRRRHDDLLRLGTSAVVSSAQSCRQVLRATDTAASGSELPVQRQRERVGAGIRAVGGEGRRGTVRRSSGREKHTHRRSRLHRLRWAVPIRRLGRILPIRLAHGLAILLRGVVGHVVRSGSTEVGAERSSTRTPMRWVRFRYRKAERTKLQCVL